MWTGLTFNDPAEAGIAKAAPRTNQLQAANPADRMPNLSFFPADTTAS